MFCAEEITNCCLKEGGPPRANKKHGKRGRRLEEVRFLIDGKKKKEKKTITGVKMKKKMG